MPLFDLLAFGEIDSTQFEARRQVELGRSKPFAVWAVSQTGGHGRFGRAWESPPGNIYCTIGIACEPPWPKDYGLPFATGLAVHDTLHSLGIAPERIALKWPNDTLVDGRKISGALIQTIPDASHSGGRFALIGIGIGINSHPDNAAFPATCLVASGLKGTNVEDARDELLDKFAGRLSQWRSGGFGAMRAEYERKFFGLGQPHVIALDRDRKIAIKGINRGVNEDGALLLEVEPGVVRVISTGDVMPDIREPAMYEGVWKNELGSELHIEKVGLDGTFVGVYLTNVGDDKVKNVQIPLIGRIQGDLISFIVDFGIDGKSKSMAAWVGRHELVSDERAATERRVIKTIWTLARLETGPADAKEPTEPWETFLTNGNIFVWHGKIPPKASS